LFYYLLLKNQNYLDRMKTHAHTTFQNKKSPRGLQITLSVTGTKVVPPRLVVLETNWPTLPPTRRISFIDRLRIVSWTTSRCRGEHYQCCLIAGRASCDTRSRSSRINSDPFGFPPKTTLSPYYGI